MFELRAAVGGIVLSVEVIEGQTVAELDDICALDSDRGRVILATEVPGVVRELYVERGLVIGQGAVIALIDES
jgi:multidrug efflux pump subunit AcrA (membrane-fusion protein)